MNWLDIVIVVCIVAGIVKGLRDGFVKQAISLVALIAAIFFAGQLAAPIRHFLTAYIASDSGSLPIINVVCYLLAFAIIILAIVLLGKVVDIAIKMTPAKPLNILLGGLFGMFIWILSLSILLNIFAVFDSKSTIIPKQAQEKSIFYSRVKDVLPALYPKIRSYF